MTGTLTPWGASAQEAVRSFLADQTAAEARSVDLESLPHTIKAGDVRLLLTPSVSLGWNNNVYLASSDEKSDFILKPQLDAQMSYPLTRRNLLTLDAGLGWEKYFQHDELSTWFVRSGSQLAVDAYVKDFEINVHDRFEYERDAAQEAAVANTAEYGNIDNLVGLLASWDLEDVVLKLGYDHENVFSTEAQFQNQDRSDELLLGSAGFRLHPRLTAGVEATGFFTTYDQSVFNDCNGFTLGAYAEWRPGTNFRVQPHVGYAAYLFQQTSLSLRTTDVNSWYADLTVTHEPTASISYSLSAGHEFRLGIQSDVTEDWYVRPHISWNFVKGATAELALPYEHGRQGAETQSGNLTETYDWFGGNILLSCWIMKKLRAGVEYRLTLRASSMADREYKQHMVQVNLTYPLQ